MIPNVVAKIRLQNLENENNKCNTLCMIKGVNHVQT